jgi:alkylation response protein AidB-like acyl-CoA dehydrogenase
MNMGSTEADETLALIAQAAADFARPDAQRTRRVRDTAHGHDPAVWAQMAEQGWLAMLMPQELGGTDLGLRAAALIAERLGYACHCEAFVPVAVLAAHCLVQCPKGEMRDRMLESIGSGARIAALAWQSPRGELAIEVAGVAAQPLADGIGLHGSLRFVAAPQADDFVVAARLQDELVLCVVPANATGLKIVRETQSDGSPSGWLYFDGVSVPAAALLAGGTAAEAALGVSVEAGVLATAAELLGVMERSMELTQDYLGVRKQFGQAIGAFQVLQHRMVDMWIQKSLTRAALDSALKVFADPASQLRDYRVAASSVKARASQAALYVAGQAVQLHGAIGVSDEYELGVYVNRSITLAAWLGNAAAHRHRFGELVPGQER